MSEQGSVVLDRRIGRETIRMLSKVAGRLGGEGEVEISLHNGGLVTANVDGVKGRSRLVSVVRQAMGCQEVFRALKATSDFSGPRSFIVLSEKCATSYVYGVLKPWPRIVNLALGFYSGLIICTLTGATMMRKWPPPDRELRDVPDELWGSPDANPITKFISREGLTGLENDEAIDRYESSLVRKGKRKGEEYRYVLTKEKQEIFMKSAVRAYPRCVVKKLW